MAPVDIRPPGYIPQGTFSGTIPGEKGIERRRKLAEVLAARGTETTPVQHWTQAAARVANSLAGALGNYQAGQMEQQRNSALAEALKTGDPNVLINSMDADLQRIGQFRLEQQQQQAQAARQAEMDARAEEHFQANFKQNADQFAATQERLNQPNFTEGTPDQKEMYGPDFVGMGPNGPIFHTPARGANPWETRTKTDEYGATSLVQVNRDTGEERPTTTPGAPPDTSAPPATGPVPPPASAMPAPAPAQSAGPNPYRQRPPKMTEGQDKSYRFYKRGRNANEIIGPEEEAALSSGVQDAIEYIPGVSNYAKSTPRQRGDTAAKAFLGSLGYSDSGAQINKDEYWRNYAMYIPSRGDGPQVIADKRRARAEALQALRGTTGPGAKAIDIEERAYAEARAAIASGRDPAAVRQTLIDNGYDPGNF